MSFANRMIELRRDKELTQQELADKIGSTQKTISSWEKGRTTPRLKELFLLCDALGCTVQDLTGMKMYNTDDISYHDMVSRVRTLDLKELKELELVINDNIKVRMEMLEIKREKERQEKRILEYTKRIAELESKIKEDKQ